jgi:hypothetical protein
MVSSGASAEMRASPVRVNERAAGKVNDRARWVSGSERNGSLSFDRKRVMRIDSAWPAVAAPGAASRSSGSRMTSSMLTPGMRTSARPTGLTPA